MAVSLSSSPESTPSPIPTAKGSRSAADPIFSDLIEKSRKIPELTLPVSVNRSVPADIDYLRLTLGDSDSVHRLLRSAVEFGAFRISGHGISAEELRSTMEEAERHYGLPVKCCRRYDNRSEFVWCRSGEALPHKYPSFSQKMEDVVSGIEMIAEQLVQIICRNTSKQSQKKIQPSESRLILHTHNHATAEQPSAYLSNAASLQDSSKYLLSLHYLPVNHGEFCVQSEPAGPLLFNTNPETIVVTIGQQLEEWSLGEFKSAHGAVRIKPERHGSQVSVSLEFKFCARSDLDYSCIHGRKKISIPDQVLIILMIAVLYIVISNSSSDV